MQAHVDLHQLIWGESPAVLSLISEIRSLASHGCRSLLVVGETGTGKDLVPRALHSLLSDDAAPYEIFNCPAIPSDHLEAELFGTTRGAFSGAIDRSGAAERASGGILFLDEVATMPLAHQAKVLRLVECGEGRRLGAARSYRADLILVAATNEDLPARMAAGEFREDLYYRLTQDGILTVPPLRERREDAPLLAEGFIAQLPAKAQLSEGARGVLRECDWPGNVRQLRAVVRVATRLAPTCQVEAEHVEEALLRFLMPRPSIEVPAAGHLEGTTEPNLGFGQATTAVRRRLLADALLSSGGNQTMAGLRLGLHRKRGEQEPVVVDRRARKLAHRKFRYWWSQLDPARTSEALPWSGAAGP